MAGRPELEREMPLRLAPDIHERIIANALIDQGSGTLSRHGARNLRTFLEETLRFFLAQGWEATNLKRANSEQLAPPQVGMVDNHR